MQEPPDLAGQWLASGYFPLFRGVTLLVQRAAYTALIASLDSTTQQAGSARG